MEAIIALRLREFRSARGLTLAALAQAAGLSKAMLSKIENAQTSCSLSTLAALAKALDVPVTALFRGIDSERESVYTPRGKAPEIVRRGSAVGHHYHLLGALRGEHKRLEPLLVTLDDGSRLFAQFRHAGTELIYMLEGVLVYGHGDTQYQMQPGDSLIFDGEAAHGPVELKKTPIRFLSVTATP